MTQGSEYQRERRQLRRDLVDQLRQLQGSCDGCGDDDLRVLSFVDDDYHTLKLANQGAAHKRLLAALQDAQLLCPSCIAKGLADQVEVLKAQVRDRKEVEAAIYRDVLAEHGKPTSLEEVGDAIGETLEALETK